MKALIFGASGGIGAALAARLYAGGDRGGDVETLSRREDGVDITDEAALRAAAGRLSRSRFDLIVNAAGALEIDGCGPEKSFREINPERMAEAFRINAIGGALFVKHFAPLLHRDQRAVFATLSARVGSITDNGLGGWMSYRASKAALNQIIKCAAIEGRRANRDSIFVAIHPGTIETALTRKYAKGRYTASPEKCAENILALLASLSAEQSGGFFDYAGAEIPW